MSDVLIKGMDIPKSCYDCVQDDNSNDFYFLINCHVWVDEICKGDINCENLPKDCRDSSCPLVEIPTPHGRLIDTDILRNKLERHRDMCGDVELAHGIDVAIRILNNAPTIIEAEVGEE